MPRSDHDREIAEMFDRIAPRYDRLNRVLSFGTDVGWRRRAVALARLGPGERAIDLGAGTGDLALGLLRASDPSSRVVAVDLSPGMLRIASRRLRGPRYAAVVGNAERLPFPEASVDRVISGFTLRNIGDLRRALAEMRRVLRPGGFAVLLELSHPPQPLFARVYRWYFGVLAPRIASALGGDPDAYRYLPRSLRPFPGAEGLAATIREAGFDDVRFERLTGGIAAIHVAERADPLDRATEIVVVLGGERGQVVRAEAAARLAHERPGAIVIASGRAGFEGPTRPTEAEIMAGVLHREGVAPGRVLLEDASRDTIGNALLTVARYLRHIAPRPLTVVTSPSHLERAVAIFRWMAPRWTVAGLASAELPFDAGRADEERRYLEEFHEMVAGIAPGDLGAIAALLRQRWPEVYGDLRI